MRTKQEKKTSDSGECGGGEGKRERWKIHKVHRSPSCLSSFFACSASVTQPVLCAVMTMDQSRSPPRKRTRERSPRNARIRRNGQTVGPSLSLFLDRQMNEYSPKSFGTPPRRTRRREGEREEGRQSGADVLRPLALHPSRVPARPCFLPSFLPSSLPSVPDFHRVESPAPLYGRYISISERREEGGGEGGDCFRGVAAPEIWREIEPHVLPIFSGSRLARQTERPLGWDWVGIGLGWGGEKHDTNEIFAMKIRIILYGAGAANRAAAAQVNLAPEPDWVAILLSSSQEVRRTDDIGDVSKNGKD